MRYKFDGFTEKANEALNLAISSASELGHTYVGSEHLLLGIIKAGGGAAANALDSRGVTAEKLEDALRTSIGYGTPTRLSPDYFTPRAKRVIETAMAGCVNMGKKYVGTEHLLLGILSEGDNYAVSFLEQFGVDVPALTSEILSVAGVSGEETGSGAAPSSGKKGKGTGKAPTLEKFGRDLTEAARKGKIDPVIGRSE